MKSLCLKIEGKIMMYRIDISLFALLVFAIAIEIDIFTTSNAFTVGTISNIRKNHHHQVQQHQPQENFLLNRKLLLVTTTNDRQSRFVLQYKDESSRRHYQEGNDPSENDDMYQQRSSSIEITESIHSGSSSSTTGSNNNIRNVIPVIGPFIQRLSCPPLIPGQEYIIKSPTPMQWNTLQESLLIHRNQKQHDFTSDEMISSSSNSAASAAAAINQAPIIALLENNNNHGRSSSRYATICAIVGMRTSSTTTSKTTETGTFDSSFSTNPLFVVNSKTKKSSLLDSTQIRLVAIGRAIIDKFYYQIPTSTIEQTTDNDGYIILDDTNTALCYDNNNMNSINDDDHDDDYEIDDVTVNDDVLLQKLNIVISEFSIISDNILYPTTTGTRNIGYTTSAGNSHKFSSSFSKGRSAGTSSSPIHALAEMSKIVFEIQTMHIQRQQLVKGIKAGRTRFAQRDMYNNNNDRNSYVHTEHEDTCLLDYDGIGELFGFTDALVNDIKAIKEHVQQQHVNVGNSFIPTQLETQYDNYGLSTGPASISTINDMVRAKMEQLQSYYSIEYQSTEEYYYEIVSYVVLESLIGWIQPNDIVWSLCTCYNTKDRLQYLLLIIQSHCSQLKYEAYYISEALLHYNEKCTDLW